MLDICTTPQSHFPFGNQVLAAKPPEWDSLGGSDDSCAAGVFMAGRLFAVVLIASAFIGSIVVASAAPSPSVHVSDR
jgi:hypothetical protein